jgi:hypothetical protein
MPSAAHASLSRASRSVRIRACRAASSDCPSSFASRASVSRVSRVPGACSSRDAEFRHGFGLAARRRENPREQGAPFGVGRRLGELSAQRGFGLGTSAGLHQSPDVVRRRTHGGRLIDSARGPSGFHGGFPGHPSLGTLHGPFCSNNKWASTRAPKTQNAAVRRRILSTRRIRPLTYGGWHETCQICLEASQGQAVRGCTATAHHRVLGNPLKSAYDPLHV